MNPNILIPFQTGQLGNLAQAFHMSESDLLAVLHRCIHFLPTHFRQFLQGHAYG